MSWLSLAGVRENVRKDRCTPRRCASLEDEIAPGRNLADRRHPFLWHIARRTQISRSSRQLPRSQFAVDEFIRPAPVQGFNTIYALAEVRQQSILYLASLQGG